VHVPGYMSCMYMTYIHVSVRIYLRRYTHMNVLYVMYMYAYSSSFSLSLVHFLTSSNNLDEKQQTMC
jgi:hypothetical protein